MRASIFAKGVNRFCTYIIESNSMHNGDGQNTMRYDESDR